MNKLLLLLALAISFNANAVSTLAEIQAKKALMMEQFAELEKEEQLLLEVEAKELALTDEQRILKANTAHVMAKLQGYKDDYLKYKDLTVIKNEDDLRNRLLPFLVVAILDLEHGDFKKGLEFALQNKIRGDATFFDSPRYISDFYRKVKGYGLLFNMRDAFITYLDKETSERVLSETPLEFGSTFGKWNVANPELSKAFEVEYKDRLVALQKHKLIVDLGVLDFSSLLSSLTDDEVAGIKRNMKKGNRHLLKKDIVIKYTIINGDR
jgi:hypothetical protein